MSTPPIPPLRSTLPAVDILSFFAAVNDAFLLFMQSEGPPDGTAPIFVHSFPKERLAIVDQPFNVITFRVVKSEMAPTSNDGSRTPRGIALREEKDHPELIDYTLVVYGWWELATVEFNIWARSSEEADKIAVWFHKFLMKYTYIYKYFQGRGINFFRFAGRGEDIYDARWGQELYMRSLQYQIRYETLDAAMQRKFTSVAVNVETLDGSGETNVISLP